MTIGPEPMIRMLSMSVRWAWLSFPGPAGCAVRAAGSAGAATITCVKRSNRRQQVMRARAGLGVALETEGGLVGQLEALQRAVEQRDVRDAATFAGSVSASTAKPWFWLVIITPPVLQFLHRMVGAVVAELHLQVRAPVARPSSWWPRQMPNTGMSRGEDFADRGDCVVAGLRVARAIGKEHAVRLQCQRLRQPVVWAGTTVTRQPTSASRRRMLRLMPKS